MSFFRDWLGVLGVGILAMAGIVGRGPAYDRTEISRVISSKLGGSIAMQRIEVPEGLVVTGRIVAYNTDKEPMALGVQSVDPSLVEVLSASTDHGFSFVGRRHGQTSIELVVEGRRVMTIEAVVTPQPGAP